MPKDNLLKVDLTYTFTVSAEEFRVILAALKTGSDNVEMAEKFRPKAQELQGRLFKLRNEQMKIYLSNFREMGVNLDEDETPHPDCIGEGIPPSTKPKH